MEGLAPVLEAVLRRAAIQLHPADWIDFRHANGPHRTAVGRGGWAVMTRSAIMIIIMTGRCVRAGIYLGRSSCRSRLMFSQREVLSSSAMMTILGWVVSEPTATGGVRYSVPSYRGAVHICAKAMAAAAAPYSRVEGAATCFPARFMSFRLF